MASAQLGQIAGGLVINVATGGSNSTTLTVFNGGDSTINYRIVPPTMTVVANEVTPAVIVYPLNGTIAPHTQIKINVTAYVASNDLPGVQWQGLIQTIGVSNSTASGGAVLQAGLGKVVFVNSMAPPPLVIPYALIAGIIVVIIIVGCGYYLLVMRKKPANAAAKGAKEKKLAKPVSDKERIRQLEAELASAKKARKLGKARARPKKTTAKRKTSARKRTRRR